ECREGEKGRVTPAAVGELKGVLVRLDRSRIAVSAEDDAWKQALATKGVHLLAKDLARTDAELLCFGHDGALPWKFLRRPNYGSRRGGEIEDDAEGPRELADLRAGEVVEADAPEQHALEVLDDLDLFDERG